VKKKPHKIKNKFNTKKMQQFFYEKIKEAGPEKVDVKQIIDDAVRKYDISRTRVIVVFNEQFIICYRELRHLKISSKKESDFEYLTQFNNPLPDHVFLGTDEDETVGSKIVK